MTKECKQQFTLRISQANSTQLIVILYEMLLCYLEEGMSAENARQLCEAVRRSRGCINELMQSLDMRYEPAPSLMQLYIYCIRRLAYCEWKAEAKVLEDVKRVIQPLHAAYEQIAGQNDKGPVMNNSQAVYAGLTYGKNCLSENVTDQGSNRGMRV